MTPSNVAAHLRDFVAKELLEGQDIGLDETTPLIEWGVINSIEMARLVTFIETEWGVKVPAELVVVEHFRTIGSIGALVDRLIADRSSP